MTPSPLSIRVYYEDTDAVGLVYHAAYLKFAERARTELLRHSGYDATTMATALQMWFVVKDLTIHYIKPAKLDDLLHIHTFLVNVKKAQCTLKQVILREEESLAVLKVRLALIDRQGRPQPFSKILLSFFNTLTLDNEINE